MISFGLDVEDLADTRFAVSPLTETVLSLRVLREPGLFPLHLPWRAGALDAISTLDTPLLDALVGPRLTLPDFLTPRPRTSAPGFGEELDLARRTPPEQVRRDLLAAHAPDRPPGALHAAADGDRDDVVALREAICTLLDRYWSIAVETHWPQMHRLLDADTTYRARRLALGGARGLFADIHPNLRWHAGTLRITKMISHHHVEAAGRGLLLVPSIFAHKPTPPVAPGEAPMIAYPSRGIATLWTEPPRGGPPALAGLLGATRARLLVLLDEPLSTVELARRFDVTPSAISQHLRVLHDNGLVLRARAGREVLYRRSLLGRQLAEPR